MTKSMKTILLTILGVLFVEVIAVLIGAYSGIPDVAATKPEGGFMSWFLNTTKDHSISSRAQTIPVPSLNDTTLIATGFGHYNEMCVTCHGAPGKKPDELAQGLNPAPPDLALSTRDMSPSEMFLVIKDGVKMTGMAGFGSTHSDSEVWAMVAFLKHLQTMSPEEYTAFQKSQNNGYMEQTEGHLHPKEHSGSY
jgi:mono/diheme cytochrome c family protein